MTCTKVEVMTDTKVVIEPHPSLLWGCKTEEQRAEKLAEWAREIKEFFRDHRSMDVNSVEAESVFEQQCSQCGWEWETDFDDEIGKTICAGCGEPVGEES